SAFSDIETNVQNASQTDAVDIWHCVRIAISDVCVGCGSRSTDRRRSILSCGRAAYCSGARLHMVMARRDSDVCRALSCWLSSNDVGRLLFVWSSAALGHVWQC